VFTSLDPSGYPAQVFNAVDPFLCHVVGK